MTCMTFIIERRKVGFLQCGQVSSYALGRHTILCKLLYNSSPLFILSFFELLRLVTFDFLNVGRLPGSQGKDGEGSTPETHCCKFS